MRLWRFTEKLPRVLGHEARHADPSYINMSSDSFRLRLPQLATGARIPLKVGC